MDTAFNWFGGKRNMAPLIVGMLPKHHSYVEVFGGSGAVLFAKTPSPVEVFNDLDEGVTGFFRTLRDAELGPELIRQLELTPYSRQEYAQTYHTWHKQTNPIERARQWYVLIQQGFSSVASKKAGWSYARTRSHNPARSFANTVDRLGQIRERMRSVQVENLPFAGIFERYDSKQTVFYLDPPYMSETRSGWGGYRHEMSDDEHKTLLLLARTCQGMVIISGYANKLYDEALGGWQRQVLTVSLSANTAKETRDTRQEVVWVKPNTARQQGLFDAMLFENEQPDEAPQSLTS